MIAKLYRLRRWRVQKILKKAEEKKIGLFIVKYLPNNCEFHRWSIVLSRRFAKLSAIRNKKKRQVYESIREITKEMPHEVAASEKKQHFDIVLIPFKQILTCKYQKIHQNINDIFKFIRTISS